MCRCIGVCRSLGGLGEGGRVGQWATGLNPTQRIKASFLSFVPLYPKHCISHFGWESDQTETYTSTHTHTHTHRHHSHRHRVIDKWTWRRSTFLMCVCVCVRQREKQKTVCLCMEHWTHLISPSKRVVYCIVHMHMQIGKIRGK